jgi:hypothetical protein
MLKANGVTASKVGKGKAAKATDADADGNEEPESPAPTPKKAAPKRKAATPAATRKALPTNRVKSEAHVKDEDSADDWDGKQENTPSEDANDSNEEVKAESSTPAKPVAAKKRAPVRAARTAAAKKAKVEDTGSSGASSPLTEPVSDTDANEGAASDGEEA